MTISIRNLYYLFAYAWAKFPDADVTDTGIDECPEILDLFAHLLVRYTKRILRQGLARDYLTFEEENPGSARKDRVAADDPAANLIEERVGLRV